MGDELVEEFATFGLGQAIDPYREIRVHIQCLVATDGMADDHFVPDILGRGLRVAVAVALVVVSCIAQMGRARTKHMAG